MKRYIIITLVLLVAAFTFNSCDETRPTYDGPAFVMFSDTLSICPAMPDGESFPIHIAAFRPCDYDRTYGVEILTGVSNAVYGYHYKLDTQTVTIPAGKTSAVVNVLPVYENIEATDSLCFQLNLLSALGDGWSEEGMLTKVRLQKVCPFDVHDFAGYCRITSDFLYRFFGDYFRTVVCEVVEEEENTLVLRDFFQDGYDLKMRFDNSDVLNPKFIVDKDQAVGDTRDLIGYPHGDNRLLVSEIAGMKPTVDVCAKISTVPLLFYVNKVGTVGGFYNILEWIEDYEVE